MKMVCAIIRPHQLESVKEALANAGIVGLTVSDVQGAGRQRGQVERYRGSEYRIDLHAKLRIEIGIADSQCDEVVKAIRESACTGEVGDGKIFVWPLTESVRIRTGETGDDAL